MSIGLIISSTYTLIRNNNLLFVPLLLSLDLALLSTMEVIISQMCKIHETSILCLRSAGSQHNSTKYYTQFQNKLHIATWKSYRSIAFWFGNMFSVKTREFILKLFGSVILESVVTLLITFH